MVPLRRAARCPARLLQFDWIHDLYIGRNTVAQMTKQLMFADGLRALRKTIVVWTIHNMIAHDSSISYRRHRRLIQQFVDVCDGLLFLSESSLVQFRDRYRIPGGTEIACTRIGHFADAYPNTVLPLAARQRLELEASATVVLHFGRLHPYKGVEPLIRAFGRSSQPGEVLLVAGQPASPAYAQVLEATAQAAQAIRGKATGRVILHLRSIPDPEVQLYFNAADFAIFPFEQILNSASVILAKSVGCPVVTPDLGSLADYATDGLDMLYAPLLPLEDVLRTALDRFCGDAFEARRPRIDLARQAHSWDSVGDTATRLYSRVSLRR